MRLARRNFLRNSFFSLSAFGFASPAVIAECARPGSGPSRDGIGRIAKTEPSNAAETVAVRGQIEANNRAVGHAIVTMDFPALKKLWAPDMQVNSPGNNILTREQVFTAMREDKLRYTNAKAIPEAFFVAGDIAIEMGHDDIVMANGPMAGKPLTRRFTNVWQKSGADWVQIARQATYVGIDGGAVYGHPDPALHP
jgi:ketosteroid isomerase-like protein